MNWPDVVVPAAIVYWLIQGQLIKFYITKKLWPRIEKLGYSLKDNYEITIKVKRRPRGRR